MSVYSGGHHIITAIEFTVPQGQRLAGNNLENTEWYIKLVKVDLSDEWLPSQSIKPQQFK
jgi:hypothetical protein